ncbi:MAG: hypothetical protein U9Q81_10820, partial [Pseudomonadota bacterium]|nr:hypothetical protein [Pseudomonadota bacterium]
QLQDEVIEREKAYKELELVQSSLKTSKAGLENANQQLQDEVIEREKAYKELELVQSSLKTSKAGLEEANRHLQAQTRDSRIQTFVIQAGQQQRKTLDDGLAALLALQAFPLNKRADDPAKRASLVNDALRDVLEGVSGRYFSETRRLIEEPPERSSILVGHDGQAVAYRKAGADYAVVLPYIDQPREITVETGGEQIRVLALHPDGTRLAGILDDSLILWDLSEPDAQLLWQEKCGDLADLAFIENGGQLVTVTQNGLWLDRHSGKKRWRLSWEGTKSSMELPPVIAVDPKGRYLAIGLPGASQSEIRLVDIQELLRKSESEQPTQMIQLSNQPGDTFPKRILDLSFDRKGERLVGVGAKQTIRVWTLEKNGKLTRIRTKNRNESKLAEDFLSAAFGKDSKIIVTGGSEGSIELWNGLDLKKLDRGDLEGQKSGVVHVDFTQEDKRILSIDTFAVERSWLLDTKTNLTVVSERHDQAEKINALRFLSGGSELISADFGGKVQFWNWSPEKDPKLREITKRDLDFASAWVRDIAVFPNPETSDSGDPSSGSLVAAAYSNDSFQIIDTASPKTRNRTVKGHTDGLWSIAFSPDGTHLATASWDKSVRLWSVEGVLAGEQEPASVLMHEQPVRAVSFHPDGKLLVTGSQDRRIHVWSISEGHGKARRLGAYEGHQGAIWALSFSPNGSLLASAGEDGQILIWTTKDWETPPARLRGHVGTVFDVAFNPDMSVYASDAAPKLASAGDDNTVGLWWEVDGRWGEPKIFSDHGKSGVQSVAFDPAGRWLASGDQRGGIRIREVKAEDLAKRLCELVTQELSNAEWERFGGSPESYDERYQCESE